MPGTKRALRRQGKIRRLALVLAAALPLAAAPPAAGKEIFGWAERVVVGPGNLDMRAKLDTGADNSSLHAVDIRRFRRGDRRYVRFTLEDPETGETLKVERRLLRRAVIKQHDGDHQRRSVVAIDVCLGDHLLRQIEVSLTDRGEFLYPVLLGRSALEGIAVVDPELTFSHEPSCDMEPKSKP